MLATALAGGGFPRLAQRGLSISRLALSHDQQGPPASTILYDWLR
jgi:hypothetical protein